MPIGKEKDQLERQAWKGKPLSIARSCPKPIPSWKYNDRGPNIILISYEKGTLTSTGQMLRICCTCVAPFFTKVVSVRVFEGVGLLNRLGLGLLKGSSDSEG